MKKPSNVGRRIDAKIWLIREGISQKEIAKLAGVSKQFISLYLEGSRNSKNVDETLIKVGCPIDFIELEQAA